ncbi:MAG: hydroxymethylbilane synthase [Candidatus Acidiferrales bacterium]
MKPVRIGARGSALALWQANHICARLQKEFGLEAEIVIIKTSGDQFTQSAVSQLGLKGVFIKELEDALIDRRVDLAVHSMKDVPTEIPKGLAFPAITRREDPRDCLISLNGKSLASLAAGAKVGTGSLRRQAQLRHHRPDLDLRDLRGNVDTRLRKLDEGMYDAIVLAKAGLDRLGVAGKITEVLEPDLMLPAVGQGALGIESRSTEGSGADQADRELFELLRGLDDSATRYGVTAERALLGELEGGCQVPLGAWGRVERGQLVLDACVLSMDGVDYLRDRLTGAPGEAEILGRRLGRKLLESGADRILRLAGRN